MQDIITLATAADAIQYISGGYKTKTECRENYEYTCEKANEIALHTCGKGLEKLFKARYTKEEQDVTDYRVNSKPTITKSYFDKIINTGQKIQRSTGWSVGWQNATGTIAADLQKYVTEDYKGYQSVENWLFQMCLQTMLSDANAVCVVLPQSWDITKTTVIEPYTYIYSSEQVLIYNPTTLLIEQKKGKKWFLATTTEFIEIINKEGKYYDRVLRVNDLKVIPAFRLGGVPVDANEPDLFESFISGVVPFWEAAIVNFSNLELTKNSHCFLQKWQMVSNCNKCNGTGRMPNTKYKGGSNRYEQCDACNNVKLSPSASVIEIRTGKNGDTPPVTPPAGYITMPVDILGILQGDWKEFISAGLAAINMEHLDNFGANQSGVAKEIDRSESNAFLHKIAKRLSMNYQYAVYYIAKWRNLLATEDAIRAALPTVNVPEQFDIYSLQYYQMQFQTLKAGGASDAQLSAAENDEIRKQHSANPTEMQYYLALANQNPLRFKLPDDVIAAEMTGVVSKVDLCIYYNLQMFTNEILITNKNYLSLDYQQQRDLLVAKAELYLKANKTAKIPEIPVLNPAV